MINIESMKDAELLSLCLEASKKLHNPRDAGYHKIFLITPRDKDFETVFRVNVEEFCKNKDDLFFISLRGIFEEYVIRYKKKYEGHYPPSKKKDKFSKPYRSAERKIKELFEKHYTPSNEYEILKIQEILEMIETAISTLETTEGSLRIKASHQAKEYLNSLGLPKTSIEKILIFFRKHMPL